MIAASLCHIKYVMRDEGREDAPEREHSAYIPIKSDHVHTDQPHFALDVIQDGGRLTVNVTPACPITITQCRVMVTGNFTSYARTLFNGYQSWTDTQEITLDAATRGLVGTPKQVVDKFVLDGSGDYRFKRYENKPGVHHGWSYAYFIGKPGVWMVGSLNETDGFTLLEWSVGDGLNISKEPPNRELAVGETTRLTDVAFIEKAALPFEGNTPRTLPDSMAKDLVDAAFDEWFDLMRTAQPDMAFPRSNRLLTGYTSWYRHYEDITDEKIKLDLASAQRAYRTLNTEGFVRLFQIDDGYSKKGDWLDVDPVKFPNGLASTAEDIRAAGFMPGIWLAPFECETDSRVFREHPDWLLHDASGSPLKANGHWSGAYPLDTLNPEVRDYVSTCLSTMAHEWGFKLFKLDFLFAACMLPHGGKNRGELMSDAMRLVRDAVGPDALIDGCGVPLASAFGVVDFCRIGCDVGLDWNGAPYMRLTERERVSTRNSLFNTVYRAPLDGRAFGNDPDVLLLRKDVRYTDGQRNMVLYGDACHASMLLTSDNFDEWTLGDIKSFQEALDLMREAHKGGRA